ELDIRFIRIFGRHVADRISDILLRRKATEALIKKATRDALTGLYNRGAIFDRLEGQLALAKRTGHPLSVILADIDFFKIINDRHGHIAGDEVLREVSLRLQTHLRDSDSLGRYGGEEFLFVLFPCSVKEVGKAAERFRSAIADTPVFWGGDSPAKIEVSISLGTSSTDGQPDVSIDALLKQTDNALYHSKAGGRNCVTVGGPDAG
ncbi:MAG: GGDEF domain-containing protein, partial [Desulfobacterales bacterium]